MIKRENYCFYQKKKFVWLFFLDIKRWHRDFSSRSIWISNKKIKRRICRYRITRTSVWKIINNDWRNHLLSRNRNRRRKKNVNTQRALIKTMSKNTTIVRFIVIIVDNLILKKNRDWIVRYWSQKVFNERSFN